MQLRERIISACADLPSEMWRILASSWGSDEVLTLGEYSNIRVAFSQATRHHNQRDASIWVAKIHNDRLYLYADKHVPIWVHELFLEEV